MCTLSPMLPASTVRLAARSHVCLMPTQPGPAHKTTAISTTCMHTLGLASQVLCCGLHCTALHSRPLYAGACFYPAPLTDVVLAALHRHHLHSGVLQGGGAVALEALHGLVGGPLAVHSHGADVLPLVRQQHLVADNDILAVSVQHDGQAQQQAVLGEGQGRGVVVSGWCWCWWCGCYTWWLMQGMV
jgi:hypothetical protein